MKVALLTDGVWPYVLGGMQKHSYYLCKYLAKNGVQVHLVHFNQSAYAIEDLEFFTEEEKKNIRATCLEFPRGLNFPGHYLYRSYQYSQLAYQAIEQDLDSYDLIYCKGFTAWHLLKLRDSGKIKTPPVAVKFHGYEMFQKAPDLKTWLQMFFLLRYPVEWISQHADIVYSYGGKITDIILSLEVERERVLELPSGIESTNLASEAKQVHKPLRFVFLGRYERRKGVEELNGALRKLLAEKEGPAFEMHFIGPIPESKRITHPQVIYHGEIRDRTLLNQKVRDCDVLLCPSWSEGFPNVLLEAMGNGLTVVATHVGAVSVLVNETNGYLLNEAPADKLADCLREILRTDPELLLRKKKAALQTVRDNFTWEKLSQEFLQQIRNLPMNLWV